MCKQAGLVILVWNIDPDMLISYL